MSIGEFNYGEVLVFTLAKIMYANGDGTQEQLMEAIQIAPGALGTGEDDAVGLFLQTDNAVNEPTATIDSVLQMHRDRLTEDQKEKLFLAAFAFATADHNLTSEPPEVNLVLQGLGKDALWKTATLGKYLRTYLKSVG